MQLMPAGRIAKYRNEELGVYIRVASLESNKHYIDLADKDNRTVVIDPKKWEIVMNPPVMFYQPQNMSPLPAPDRNGNALKLGDFINISPDCLKVLIVVLIEWMREETVYPVVELIGEQGERNIIRESLSEGSCGPQHGSTETHAKASPGCICRSSQCAFTSN